MQNLEVIYRKYPGKEAFLSHLVLFTDEVCARILKEDEERLASILKTLEEKDQIDAENKELLDSALKILEQRGQTLQEPASKAQELGSKAQEPETKASVQKTDVKLSKSSQSKNKWAVIFSILGLIICVAIMLWMVMGLLMALNVCPEYDLGYQWFNNNVLEIF
jgi:Mg2+/Co2+ transporter CorC